MKKAEPSKKEVSDPEKEIEEKKEDSLIVIEEKAEETKTEEAKEASDEKTETNEEENKEKEVEKPTKTEEPKETEKEEKQPELDQPQPVFEENMEVKKPSFKRWIFLGLIVLSIAATIFVIASAIFLKNDQAGDSAETKQESQKQEEPTNTPTLTPTPTPDRGKIQLKVLNGGGIPGLAGKAKEFLESLGYKDIKTGNADSYDYQETEISVKEGAAGYLDLVIEDLGENYSVSSDSSTLEKDSPFDIIVILGKKKS